MAPSRQAGESARRVNRQLNASPYARKVTNQPKSDAQADAGQVNKSKSLAALFSIFNPFNYLGKRAEPPQSLPQLMARNDSSSQPDEQAGHESDTHTELDMEGDSMFVDHALKGLLASSQKSPQKPSPSQIPFPLLSPARNWDTPGTSRRGNVVQTTNGFPRGRFSPASPASSTHTSATVGHTVGSPLKPIQDFLGQRTRAGVGLSAEEVQKLTGMLSAENVGRDESDLPTAAFLARDISPSPSKSFFAPQQASAPFKFQAGNNAGSTAMSTASPSRQRRHRPIYVGPGQGSNLRPSRSPIVMPPLSTSLPLPPAGINTADSGPSEDASGKRRRVDGLCSSAAPLAITSQEVNGDTAASQHDNETQPEIPHASSSTSTSGASRPAPALASARGGPLRGHATASPVVPSPLRNMTKADDPPSPPRRSFTSATVMNIIAKADKELSVSESKAEVEQAIVNPYERTGPKVPLSGRKKPIPVKKPAPSPPKPEPKKPELPSSAQAIADSLPTPKLSAAKSNGNGNVFKAPFAKPSSSSSPFLPPGKTTTASKTNGTSTGPFTIDDVDEEDEIMEVADPEGSSSKSQKNGAPSRGRGPSPPPIVVEELSEEEMAESSQKAVKPSVVVEPTEPKRIGRSPSLGPYPNLYSPTIPSPLRLVSMPEEDELAGDIDMPDAAVPRQSLRAAALELLPKPSDVEMEDDSNVDPKAKAEKAPVSSLPSYKFDFTVTALAIIPGIDLSAKAKASTLLATELPNFDMFAKADAVPVPVNPPANNWAASGFVFAKPAGTWTCDQCMLSNPDSAKDKCSFCDADRPGAKAKATSTPVPPPQPAPMNNWAASGFTFSKPAGTWTCDQCMLSNPESAKDKCSFCEADRPGAKANSTSIAPPLPQPAPANNWAASGFTFAKPATGTWTCTTCMLSNPATAKDKCEFCQADAPGSKMETSTGTAPASIAPSAPTPGFNWDAAGFKPKAVAAGSWTCSVCGLNNGPELTKCGVCEAAR